MNLAQFPVDGKGPKLRDETRRVMVMATKKAFLYERNLSKTSERGLEPEGRKERQKWWLMPTDVPGTYTIGRRPSR